MDSAEYSRFEAAMAQVTDWVLHYRSAITSLPVGYSVKPGDVLKQLPEAAPVEAEAFSEIFADFKNVIMPGITHWQHPKFFGYFPSNSSPPSVLAEVLVAAIGAQCMSWATSPAATELELKVMTWFRDALSLADDYHGVIQDSASTATMMALLVARERATDFSINEYGYEGKRLVVYCSEEAHSSVEKSAKIIGLGRSGVRKIPVDARQSMRMDLLEQAIRDDLAAGLLPICVVGTFGTTGTTGIDDLEALSRLAKQYGIWLHVDAAFAGSMLLLPEMRPLARGLSAADSIVVNPHKSLFTTFGCSAFFVRDRDALIRTLTILPEYLRTPDDDVVTNLRDWGPGLGRPFRALKLWFVMRWYGTSGLQAMTRKHLALARTFAGLVADSPSFELVGDPRFSLVCFRWRGSDDDNLKLLHRLNQSGRMFLTHTKVQGAIVLRFVVGQTDVTEDLVREAWLEICECAESLSSQQE